MERVDLRPLDRGWKLKSKSASVLTAGSQLERIAVSKRRLLWSAIWAARSRSMACAAVVARQGRHDRIRKPP